MQVLEQLGALSGPGMAATSLMVAALVFTSLCGACIREERYIGPDLGVFTVALVAMTVLVNVNAPAAR